MNNIQIFQFENLPLNVIDKAGEPWFIAKEVCEILEISNYRDAVSKLDDDEKGVAKTDTLGGEQETNIISESGLYTLIIRSNKPNARKFRKWVTGVVLPSIRKTGGYALQEVSHMEHKALYEKIISLQEEVISLYRQINVSRYKKPVVITEYEILKIKEMYDAGLSTKAISRHFGIPINKILEILQIEIY